MNTITMEDILQNKDIATYLKMGNQLVKSMGYTDHSAAHTMLVATNAKKILSGLGYSSRDCELVEIAGYMHDMGNVINRFQHEQNGAYMAFSILTKMGMDAEEIAIIIGAIGNHDESTGNPINPITAALIIADKIDMRASRVQVEEADYDIHDTINSAVIKTEISVDKSQKTITCEMTYDTTKADIFEYFHQYSGRIKMCIDSAKFLGVKFHFSVNGFFVTR